MISILLALAGLAPSGVPRDLLEQGSGPGAWSYLYGGTSKGGITSTAEGKLLTFQGDDREYSGLTVHLPKTMDLSPLRTQGALKIKIRGALGGEQVLIGLLDDESDGADHKTQVRVAIKDFVQIDKTWKLATIPLAEFDDQGAWWDPKNRQEVAGKIDWSKIAEVRVMSNQDANRTRVDTSGRFQIEIGQWQVVDTCEVWNAAAYWKFFKSNTPDDTLEAFGGTNPAARWFVRGDEGSHYAIKLADPKDGRALELTYTMESWVTLGASLANLLGKTKADWTHHAAIAAEIWSPRNGVGLQVQVTDSGKEQWVRNAYLAPGWNTVIVPFKDFLRNAAWQPDGALANRKLDLNGVQTLGFQPLQGGAATTIRIGSIRLTNQTPDALALTNSMAIRWNHLGYAPNATKRIVVATPTDSTIKLLDAAGKSVWTGRLTPASKWEPSEEMASTADFSSWQKPGTYSLAIGKTKSAPFKIAADVYSTTLRDAVRAFYFQRASTELPVKHVGVWARPSAHPDTNLTLLEAGREGKWGATGGWYDAGDYGKYTLNGAVSVAVMLDAFDLYPERFPDKSLNIPESGNGVSDLLDECIWELDWMTRMQDADGGLFFKIATTSWDGFVPPSKARNQRFVIGKSTTSTLTYAAVAAQASRILKTIDKTRSQDLLTRAERAWNWAQKNPNVREPRETGGSGPYQDSNFSDEFLWAATELWLTSAKPEYRAAAKASFDTVAIQQTTSWQSVQNLAYYHVALHGGKDTLAGRAKQLIDSVAGTINKQLEASAYRTPLEGFPWASNDVACQKAALLAWAAKFKPGAAKTGIQETVDYVLGKNATGYSFVTGTGALSAQNPHHRILGSDTVAAPFPGFLVGGPNADRQDDIKKASWGVEYTHTEPAKSWMDTEKSYASNEVCINWNAALIFALAALEHDIASKNKP